jgi:adenine C2-methylase RlmN of 23S rRNA A2503 and tRNA A37
MGMGEPFLNWEAVSESLKMLTDKNLFGLGSRSISVSTSGIIEGIEKLATEFPQINLAISLHFTDDHIRSQFMPVNQKNNLAALRGAIQKYLRKTNRQIFIEYILLDKVNDSRFAALLLADFVKSLGRLQLIHVNLIRYNITSADLQPSSATIAQKFKQTLLASGIQATIRKSLGEEIQGACGQLAGQ